ncbi:hypothetical protein A3A39_01940 [Candidatus Kaiserbacteria bacterium RIFCSPLOWO2_01_FULL_54_13]|uniref:Uncharacterized protein n=1 Tax=Candidatus Kaiserbacteria bacterium RIFCSPLOWO2_01_FULL_54_13 TaxID=1798512 RepID=A0A1F6F0I4_9BACT|nr:MAG: hypothetical protein A3A39_01940 [Candidatus Kaiserbacteria bacterium RIFCSPLOWO2_01_FULL_54_13]
MDNRLGNQKSIAQSAIERETLEHIETLVRSNIKPLEVVPTSEEDLEIVREATLKINENLRYHRLPETLLSTSPKIVMARDGRIVVNSMTQKTRQVEGMTLWFSDEILLGDQLRKDPSFYKHVVVHEGWHKISDQSPRVVHATGDFFAYLQTGLHRQRVNQSAQRISQHFWGLNEAITEKLTIETLREGIKGLEYAGYTHERMVLDNILDKLSSNNLGEREALWHVFVHGYINGDYSFLTDLDRFFGQGALRVLAKLPPIQRDGTGLAFRVGEYFSTQTTDSERLKIRDEIFQEPSGPITIIGGKIHR